MDSASAGHESGAERLSSALARVGLVGTAILCWRAASLLWEGGTTPTDTVSTVMMLLATVAGFGLLGLAVVEHRHGGLAQWVIPPALGIVTWCYLQNHAAAQLENGPVTTDVQIYMDYAARLLREGINPYTADLLDAYRVQRMPLTFSTPLADGDLTGRVAYPALHVLLFVPFQWLGVPTTWVYLLSLLVTLAAIYARCPGPWRPLVLLPVFIDSRILLFTLGGVSDCVWAMLLCFMVLGWKSRFARAIWYGLALSFKHQPWALAPFLLIRIWHESRGTGGRPERLRELYWFTGLSAATFAVINLPFVLWSPEAWFAGVFEPLRAPMITFGQGLSALSMSGLAPLPKWLFSLLTAVVLLGGLAAYEALLPRARLTLWLVPALALWLSHRSLSSYWYFFLLPLLADTLRPTGDTAARPLAPGAKRRLIASAAAVAAVVALALVVGLTRKRPFEVVVQTPLGTSGARVTRMSVAIENRTDSPVRPRIAVQSVGLQPYFWIVDQGSPTLEPGQRELYRIRAGAPHEQFSIRHGAQVIVTAADDLNLRAATRLPGDVSAGYRDAIPNGRFRYWAESGASPSFWGVVAEPAGAGVVRASKPSGDGAPADGVILELGEASDDEDGSLAERRVLLDTFVVLPHEPIEMTVRVPPGANELPDLDVIYGLRLLVRRQEAWVLFGDEQTQGDVSGTIHFHMIEAPRDQWSTHSIDLRQILGELGTSLRPQYERRTGKVSLGYPVVPANVQLMLMARGPYGKLEAELGPVVATALRPSADRLFAETQAMPELMPLWRGDLAFTYGNFDKARQHYLSAMEVSPTEVLPQLRIAETEFWIGDWEASLAAYQAVLNRDAKEPLAYKGAGWCHYNLERYDQAIAAWRSALQLFELQGDAAERTHVADAQRGMAMAAWRGGDCAAARDNAAAARALHPAVHFPAELLSECAP